jgi:1-acyl-sn-glycerol-3-phosphate acyltransferase
MSILKPLSYFFDTPSSGKGRFPQRFCFLFCLVLRIVFKILFRYRACGVEHLRGLPRGSGAIIVGHHVSYLDPVFVMAVMRPRPIRYMGKEEFFSFNPLIARFAAWVGVFPVKRESADMVAVKRTVRMLKRGELVGIFPEGTRVRSEDQEVKYHEGVALIAQLADAPVIPMRLWGVERVRPEGTRLFHPVKIRLCFGKPVYISEERFASLPKAERFSVFTNEIMERAQSLEPPR